MLWCLRNTKVKHFIRGFAWVSGLILTCCKMIRFPFGRIKGLIPKFEIHWKEGWVYFQSCMGSFVIFFTLERNGLACSPGWLSIPFLVNGALELQSLLLPPPKNKDYGSMSPHPAYGVLGIEPMIFCILGKYSAICIFRTASWWWFWRYMILKFHLRYREPRLCGESAS